MKVIILFLTFLISKGNSARNGIALFNNTASGIQGAITLHYNTGLGSYLMGQLRNISCLNGTSATNNPKQASLINSCMLGISINNWRHITIEDNKAAPGEHILLPDGHSDQWEWRQMLFNFSNIRLPNIREIFSQPLNPLQSIFPMFTTEEPSIRETNGANNTCANVGNVYNPRRNIMSGPLGLLSPPGVMGNILVSNGTGSLLMGPLELLTAGPLKLSGKSLVVWMDAMQPMINGTSGIGLQTGPNNRILDCATIQPIN